MSAKSELLAWVQMRAMDEDDTKQASRLIAAYCAEMVKLDRATRPAFDAKVADALRNLDMFGARPRR